MIRRRSSSVATHQPEIVLTTDSAGRHRAVCRACMDGSTPSFHRGIAEHWRTVHIREALPPNKEIR